MDNLSLTRPRDAGQADFGRVFVHSTRPGRAFGAVFILFVAASLVPCLGQEAEPGDAPPPPKVISKEERSQLEAQSDVKKRTNLALELMSSRLAKAEQLSASKDHDAMYLELGVFQALIDDTLDFLDKGNRNSGKVLNNFKKFEIGLRAFAPRLEVIRRELPARYEFYVRRLALFVRDARAKAIEPLFADSVVPNNKP